MAPTSHPFFRSTGSFGDMVVCLVAPQQADETFFTLKVDESQLSEDCSLPPPPSYPGHSSPYVQMALPGGGIVSMPLDSSSGVCSSPDPSQASIGPDVLSVSAGEPVTHFNLDQLLEIVQSFQLDTSQAQDGDPAQKKVLGEVAFLFG